MIVVVMTVVIVAMIAAAVADGHFAGGEAENGENDEGQTCDETLDSKGSIQIMDHSASGDHPDKDNPPDREKDSADDAPGRLLILGSRGHGGS